MNQAAQFAIDVIRARLLGPKDMFERAKKRLVRWLLTPLLAVAAAPALVLGVLNAVDFLSFEGMGIVLRMAGALSNDLLVLTVGIVLSFCAALGANLAYGRLIAQHKVQIDALADRTKRKSSYLSHRNNYDALLAEGKSDAAMRLGNYLFHSFPEECQMDPVLVRGMAEAGDLLLPAPAAQVTLPPPNRDTGPAGDPPPPRQSGEG